ncbi:MAG: phosphate/phosphite/phosphonate ABC transporter substrate-binding protein [Gammaproteobacteria bacterium]|jgi:phosphonate transport system substrate-binding protein|nr:phosphate/phosphite/phosphonate ABC transporter substrate-binding protein [Gammaproteobacteria bacterium]MBT4606077.1 phosphate/phosphite/phosphonate ABC transporter substrate-binding protein [Thiotrichales bacterium]MBT3471870.1 phosphate/phosphite/phosphonate ABC transporter substrate-binding protein [Gammaproteobacteria bacterium]MBT3967117.1 phosphate/phosphite/phosphonate ABC transporter substrate-binding protein [Gammaproteobacteria bacterium]MBT4082013.1 phosphate/phosphite/phosphonat
MIYFTQLCKVALSALLLLPITVDAEPLHIGSITNEYVAEIKKFKPLTEYLRTQLSSQNIGPITLVISNSMEDMADKIRSGEVDLFIDSPYPSIVVSQHAGAEMRLRRWKKGVESYHSVIFVRKESPFSTLDDLKGQRIAFEEPFSTASYFLGKVELIKQGIKPVALPNRAHPHNTAPNQISYLFSGEDSTTITWVLRKRVEAGAINQQKFNKLKPKIRNQLKIIHHSPSVPRHIVSFRANLPQQTVDAVSKALLTMEQSEAGRAALQAFERTRKFGTIPAAFQDNLQQLKEIIKQTDSP